MKFLSNLDLRQSQILNAVIQHLAAHPENPVKGQIYFNTTDDKFYGFTENSQWVDLSNVYDDTAIKSNIADLQSALEKEVGDRESADRGLSDRIDAIEEGSASAQHTHEAEDVNFKADMLTVNPLGGISAGEDLNGLSVQALLTKLLYPYVAPNVSVSGTPNGGTYEKGNDQTITKVRVAVTKKSEAITKVEIKDGGSSLGVKEGEEVKNGGSFDFTVNVPVASVNKQLRGYVTDASGKTYEASTGAFNFYYPYYYGVVDADKSELTESDIKAMSKVVEGKGNKSRSYTVNNQRMVIAYPKAHGVLKSIVDPNGFDNLAAFARAEINIVGLDETSQAYYVYVNGASTNTNFTMKFNY